MVCLFMLPLSGFAQEAVEYVPNEYFKAKVIEVLEEGEIEKYEGVKETYQKVRIELLDGAEAGKRMDLEQGKTFTLQKNQVVAKGESVVVIKTPVGENIQYFITDSYRLSSMAWLLAFFVALTVWVGRKRGAMSFLGLVFSIAVLYWVILPLFAKGYSALWVGILGAIGIATISIYVSHGRNIKSTISLVSIILSLILTTIVSYLAVGGAHLLGLGSEESVFVGQLTTLDLQGLLLAAMILGALGVLDDIVTAQVSSIYELRRANPALGFRELYRRGLNIGKDHIASLVNTLVLAYVGASLPLFLLFYLDSQVPFWVTLNSETIAQEVIRTLSGSIGLVLSVPIATSLAAWVFGRRELVVASGENSDSHAGHGH
ncbi:MAG: hypothetical protein G01um101418_174 [Parcubacteria group bacterium Gr01-1014_18]|nr:MAG: hypothetical protein Greene041636_142 [Parcubacteria group bacterium Greene0416_36]TSC81334.1 MAG: hypothetical protein G01um101418_174 [Parcubacteria group bacterium Gr01-1014_18]TSC99480.1 MAG: hypothetical protein Greene101420_147 [Parcubacteria group bacterium Greene1014_20]TSD07601.1 MAG: hypothetical protein Greene07142_58 [Parcubacteria group bacterium Greene0714_2]